MKIILLISALSKNLLNYLIQVKELIEHLMDDDENMADLYLSRKLEGGASSPISGANNWIVSSPSTKTFLRDENDVDELEMLLEVVIIYIYF
jgi:magnesium transporter